MEPKNYSLRREDYSIKNCLFWGVSKAHFQQTKAAFEGKAYGRAFQHLVAGLFEAIPFLGQILSLAERRFAAMPTNTPRDNELSRDSLPIRSLRDASVDEEPVPRRILTVGREPTSPSSTISVVDPKGILKPFFLELKAVINGTEPTEKQRGMLEFRNYVKTLNPELQGVVQGNTSSSSILLSFLWIQWALNVYKTTENWNHIPFIGLENTAPVVLLLVLQRIVEQDTYKTPLHRLHQTNFTPFIPDDNEVVSLTKGNSTLENIVKARIASTHLEETESAVKDLWTRIAKLCGTLASQPSEDDDIAAPPSLLSQSSVGEPALSPTIKNNNEEIAEKFLKIVQLSIPSKEVISLTLQEITGFLSQGGSLNIIDTTEPKVFINKTSTYITGCNSGMNRSQVARAVLLNHDRSVPYVLAGGDSAMNPQGQFAMPITKLDEASDHPHFVEAFTLSEKEPITKLDPHMSSEYLEDEALLTAKKTEFQTFVNDLPPCHFITFHSAVASVIKRLLARKGSLAGFTVSFCPWKDEIAHPSSPLKRFSKEAYQTFGDKLEGCLEFEE